MRPRKPGSFIILLKLSLDCLFLFFSPEELFNWLFRVVDATDESAEDSDTNDGVKDELEADEDLDVSSLPHSDINEAGIYIISGFFRRFFGNCKQILAEILS